MRSIPLRRELNVINESLLMNNYLNDLPVDIQEQIRQSRSGQTKQNNFFTNLEKLFLIRKEKWKFSMETDDFHQKAQISKLE